MGKIKAVVFDLDGMVFLTEGYFSQYAIKRYGLDPDKVNDFFRTDFKDCLTGKKDLKALLTGKLRAFGWEGTAQEFLDEWHRYGRIDSEILSLIKKLKEKGVRCILATNNEIYRMDFFIRAHGFDGLFDRMVISGREGVCKPDREMFLRIEKAASADKDEILFCDDTPEHIEEAGKYGFRTLLYNNIADFKKCLSSYGIDA